MKFKYLLLVFISIHTPFNLLLSQPSKKNSTEYICLYKTIFNFNFDRSNTNFRSLKSELFINESGSTFFMTPTKETYEKDDEELSITVKLDTLFRVIKYIDSGFAVFGDRFFTKKETFYKDSLNSMKWELIDEKKMIDSIDCFKAMAFFRGRNYIAWYAPNIAIANGPWKLGGLPGLIIEAYDEKMDMHFTLEKLIKNKTSKYEYSFSKTILVLSFLLC